MSMIIRFNSFYEQFKKTELWRDMLNTREDSPWHREENVAEHTRMVVDWYKRNMLKNRGEHQQLLTLLACVFHDVGKPVSEVHKYRADIGHYRAYAGHAKASSEMWTKFALSDYSVGALQLTLDDVANIALMIEHHAPFKMNDAALLNLKQLLTAKIGESGIRAWLDFILADQHGRIEDTHNKNLEEIYEWVNKWEML